jgi:predicted GIY-YIG superfamily endonuclease
MKYYVYKTTNKLNGKIYIGKTIDFQKRLKGHTKYREDKYSYFSNAIKRNGKKKFVCEFLVDCHDEETLLKAEKYFIAYYRSNERKFGYNLTDGGDGVMPNKETRKKMKIKANENKKVGEQNQFYKKLTQEEIEFIIKSYSELKLSLGQLRDLFFKKFNKLYYRKKFYDTLRKNNIQIRSREEQTTINIKGKTVDQISEKAAAANQKRFVVFEGKIKDFVLDARLKQKLSLKTISDLLRSKFNFIASEKVIRQNLKTLNAFENIRDSWSQRISKSHYGKKLTQETKNKLSIAISNKHKTDIKYHKKAIANLNKKEI